MAEPHDGMVRGPQGMAQPHDGMVQGPQHTAQPPSLTVHGRPLLPDAACSAQEPPPFTVA